MAITDLSVDFAGVGKVLVLDGGVPADSVLRVLSDLAGVDAIQAGPTYLRLATTESAVALWLGRSSRARATITVIGADPAKGQVVVDVTHHPNPRLREQGWVTVLGQPVGLLQNAADECVSHLIISLLKESYAGEVIEIREKKRTNLSPTALAANELVKALRYLERPLSDDLATAKGEADARLTRAWDAWDAFAAVANAALGAAAPAILAKLARRADFVAEQNLHHPLASAHAQFGALHSIHYSLSTARLQATAAEGANAAPPNYDRMAEYITRDLVAFYQLCRSTTTNDDVLGALVEERIRRLLRRWLGSKQLGTGSLAGLPADYQIDGIVWDPTVRPALLEEGEIVIIDPLAALGLVEVKASCDIEQFSRRLFDLAAHIGGYYDRFAEGRSHPPMFGFVIWDKDDYESIRRRTGGMITCLSRRQRPDQFDPDPRAVADLLTFVYSRLHRQQ